MNVVALGSKLIAPIESLIGISVTIFMCAALVASDAWPMIPLQIFWCYVAMPFVEACGYFESCLQHWSLRTYLWTVNGWWGRLFRTLVEWFQTGFLMAVMTLCLMFPTVLALCWFGFSPVPIFLLMLGLHCSLFLSLAVVPQTKISSYVDTFSLFMQRGSAWENLEDERAKQSLSQWNCPQCYHCYEPKAFRIRQPFFVDDDKYQDFNRHTPIVVAECTYCHRWTFWNSQGESISPELPRDIFQDPEELE